MTAPAVDVKPAASVEFREPSLGRPAHRVGVLTTVRVEPLAEVALPVDERDADHSQAEVGGATQQVAGEDAQATRVRRDVALEGDLHREIGDMRVVPLLPYHVVHGHEACVQPIGQSAGPRGRIEKSRGLTARPQWCVALAPRPGGSAACRRGKGTAAA